jgi:hypothetical protein
MAKGATDAEVTEAIAEHRAWHRWAKPTAPFQPRVAVEFNGVRVLRRPHRRKEQWIVDWAGMARLTEPRLVDGLTVFMADYGRPPEQDPT